MPNKNLPWLVALLTVFFPMRTVMAEELPLMIEVFNHGPLVVAAIPNTHISVINLREADDINEQAPLFTFDPKNPDGQAQAQQQVIDWAKSPAGKAHRERLHQSWRAVEHLYNCGIEKVPAIAFEHCAYVIYGTTDIVRAIRDFQSFKGQSVQ